MSSTVDAAQIREIRRRRTFAIISHPDAGKTTMTEKLLLYGGAIHLAGSVKSRKAQRHATSDWMEIEKQRGISVTSSVMQFEYDGYCINILDTPGHQDFSEDTYRTLHAADAAVMLLDGARGVEPQTIKLFHVCRMRGIPIFTFINKMDRAAKPPFDLMDELEKVLGIESYPMNWPIGIHGDFFGIYDRRQGEVLRFDSDGTHGRDRVAIETLGLDDPRLEELVGDRETVAQLRDDVELLDFAGDDFDHERVQKGLLTPLFFGSALTNFGVEPFLKAFLELAPPPAARESSEGPVEATDPRFTGFVFKIQANMNPEHRDRLAFIRICSGAYERNMTVRHVREGREIRLAQPQQFLAQERHVVEEAYAGDIIGVFDPGQFRIGDSLVSGSTDLTFEAIPSFPPEHFAMVAASDSMKRKAFIKGIEQLAQEGAVQLYQRPDVGTETYVVGVVGVLQLDVLEHRLLGEYRVPIRRRALDYRFARWIRWKEGAERRESDPFVGLNLTSTTMPVLDRNGDPVLLFESDWAISWARERNPGIELLEINER
ncbi:MAG: peptide chain release factor 3 [Bacillota bacterium]|nr:peptide chain release factor 3 [Bacillota bacterium]